MNCESDPVRQCSLLEPLVAVFLRGWCKVERLDVALPFDLGFDELVDRLERAWIDEGNELPLVGPISSSTLSVSGRILSLIFLPSLWAW